MAKTAGVLTEIMLPEQWEYTIGNKTLNYMVNVVLLKNTDNPEINENFERVFTTLAKKYEQELRFFKVDMAHRNVVVNCMVNQLQNPQIDSFPQIFFFQNNYEVQRISGTEPTAVPSVVKMCQEYADNFVIPETDPEALNKKLEGLINQSPITLFIKGKKDKPACGFSGKAVKLVKDEIEALGRTDTDTMFTTFDIFGDEEVRQGLKEYSHWPTYPQLYCEGELLGGLDVMREMAEDGSLREALQEPFKKLEAKLKTLINQAPVVLFMKGDPETPKCGFSRKAVEALMGIDALVDAGKTKKVLETFDILGDNLVRQGLKEFSNWPTFPQLYVKGELLGGIDIIQEMVQDGSLAEEIQTAVQQV